jgi:hypothetical protein
MVRDARRCRAPHHEGPHPRVTASPLSLEERALARVSKDEATQLENRGFLLRCDTARRSATASPGIFSM